VHIYEEKIDWDARPGCWNCKYKDCSYMEYPCGECYCDPQENWNCNKWEAEEK